MGGARRDSLRHRLHEPGARLRHQFADPRVLRLGGAAHGRLGDPARHAPAGGEASVSLAGLVQGTVQGPARMTSVVRRAVDHYHELLSDELAAESQAALEAELRSRGLFFGERPLCTVLRFLRRFDVRPLPARHGVLNALYEAYGQWGGGRGGRGGRAAPRIGILDWREVPTYSEFVLFAEYFRAHGLDVVIGDPREAELRNGAFLLGGAPVDLIYKRVLLAELMARGGCDHPVIRAVRSGAVCMVNPFRCKILHKKASLAVLSDERNAKLFSVVERRAIDAHVPWTRTVAEQKTLHGGRKVDLVPFILAQRDRLVLKPNDEYGGKGIVLGWETDDAAWQRAVGAALAEPYVVQERVPIPSESFPSLVEGRVIYADRILDTNPFACHGAYARGCLSRLSTAALVNVTAGGGSPVPTVLVEARWSHRRSRPASRRRTQALNPPTAGPSRTAPRPSTGV